MEYGVDLHTLSKSVCLFKKTALMYILINEWIKCFFTIITFTELQVEFMMNVLCQCMKHEISPD